MEAALAGTPILPGEASASEAAAYADATMSPHNEAADAAADESTDEVVNNDTLFNDAVVGIEAAVPSWRMQIEMALGHPTPLVIDWASLDGRYNLVQGMVHVGVVQSLGAICEVGFDPLTKQTLGEMVQSVRIVHVEGVAPGYRVGMQDGGELVFWLDATRR